jgi:hypothetical protein
MEVLQLGVSKRRLSNSSSRLAKLHNRSVDNSQRSPSKLRLSSSCNMRISNRRHSRLCNSRRRSSGNLTQAADATCTIASATGGGA